MQLCGTFHPLDHSNSVHHVAAVMWLLFSLLLWGSYASANTQVFLDLGQQQAIANCKALATDGKFVNAVPDGEGGWNCIGCEGEACESTNKLTNLLDHCANERLLE